MKTKDKNKIMKCSGGWESNTLCKENNVMNNGTFLFRNNADKIK